MSLHGDFIFHALVVGVIVLLLGYRVLGIVKSVRAAQKTHDPLRRHTLRIVCRVDIVRLVCTAIVLVAAVLVDVTDEQNTRADMHAMLSLLLATAAIAVIAEIVGHRIVRRYVGMAHDDPGEPAPPIPLRPVRDTEGGSADGEH